MKSQLSDTLYCSLINECGVGECGFGGNIMAKADWKPGDGLGKEKQGITTPILGEEEGHTPVLEPKSGCMN